MEEKKHNDSIIPTKGKGGFRRWLTFLTFKRSTV